MKDVMSQNHFGDHINISEDKENFEDFSDIESLKVVAKELVFIRKQIDKSMSRICFKIRKLEKNRKSTEIRKTIPVSIKQKTKKEEKKQEPIVSDQESDSSSYQESDFSYEEESYSDQFKSEEEMSKDNIDETYLDNTLVVAYPFKPIYYNRRIYPESDSSSYQGRDPSSYIDETYPEYSKEDKSNEEMSQDAIDYQEIDSSSYQVRDPSNDTDESDSLNSQESTSEYSFSVLGKDLTREQHYKLISDNIIREAELEMKLYVLNNMMKQTKKQRHYAEEELEIMLSEPSTEEESDRVDQIQTRNTEENTIFPEEYTNEQVLIQNQDCLDLEEPYLTKVDPIPKWTNQQLYTMLIWLRENRDLNKHWNKLVKSKILKGKNKGQMKKAFYKLVNYIPQKEDQQVYSKRAKYLLKNYRWDSP